VDSSNNPYPPLLSLAVHEFRTPASVVGGYLRMLQKDQDPPMSERQRRMIDEAEKSCARLVAIVAELSEIGKLDSGVVKLSKQPLDLFSLTENVAELVHEASDRDVHLKLSGPSDGAQMTGDATRLRTAIDAVFRAILREKPGPSTVVAERRQVTSDGASNAVLIVADEGRVQEAYDREPGPFDEKRGGLGLALPLARRVIEGHGGRIWSPAAAASATADNSDPLARGSVIISFPLGS
jgi:signal transduction histidine kinase